ncbi:hypothetical protein BJ912DRAFT_1137985 [Pholiota molesta]|nr:hypothetical protein BJ912DRAFT_1137985 [Pholiota molesta]
MSENFERFPGVEKRGNQSPSRFEAAPAHAHLDIDSKGDRTLANKLAAAEKHSNEEDSNNSGVSNPTAPARAHGNEPSRGAKIDAEIQRDEEEYLKKKMD